MRHEHTITRPFLFVAEEPMRAAVKLASHRKSARAKIGFGCVLCFLDACSGRRLSMQSEVADRYCPVFGEPLGDDAPKRADRHREQKQHDERDVRYRMEYAGE